MGTWAWFAVLGGAPCGIAVKAVCTPLAEIADCVVATAHAVSRCCVAGFRVTVATAACAPSETGSANVSDVSRSTLLAREPVVAGGAGALLHFDCQCLAAGPVGHRRRQ
uniref:Putative secreted protein n=1 Tax=Ixodes ricinus TaxID=34613 RepID=A0A6B0UHZ5_IXORI